MKLNQRENQGPAAALVLAGAVLLASGCGGGESAKPEATHPDSKVTISESVKLFQEQLKRERGCRGKRFPRTRGDRPGGPPGAALDWDAVPPHTRG